MPVYRVISYILLAIAGFFALIDLLLLLVSFANPTGFFAVFLITSVIIYTFTSFSFQREGIQKGRGLKASLRDWIRVNAFVAIFFGIMCAANFVVLLSQPKLVEDMYSQALKMQPSYASSGVSKESFMRMFTGIMIAFIIYCLLLLAHITITFSLLKQYKHLFGAAGNKPRNERDELI